jgi:hypothetical protein
MQSAFSSNFTNDQSIRSLQSLIYMICVSLFSNSAFGMSGFGSFGFWASYKLFGVAAARPDGFLEADGCATPSQDVY